MNKPDKLIILNNKQYVVLLGLVILSSSLGGFFCHKLFSPGLLFAKDTTQTDKILSAEEFRLIDKKGVLHLGIKLDESELTGGPVINFYDHKRNKSITLGILGLIGPRLSFFEDRKEFLSVGDGYIFLNNKQGAGIQIMLSQDKEDPKIIMRYKDKEPALHIGSLTGDEASIGIWNRSGKMVYRAP
jgi:hypothetical protein